MATIDRYYYGPITHEFLNVTEVVGGRDGINLAEDVMIVQALLRFLKDFYRGFPESECPPITGGLDSMTRAAIEKYQKISNKERIKALGRLVQDGRVSPARGDSFVFGGGNFTWTILSLNFWARLSANSGPGDDRGYMREMFERWDVLRNGVSLSLD